MSATGLYQQATRTIKRMRNHVVPVSLFRCENNGVQGTFLYAGWDRKLRYYWMHRLYGKGTCHLRKKLILRRRLKYFLLDPKKPVDIMIIESSTLQPGSDQFQYVFELPRWMEMIIEIEPSIKKSATKEILRRIRKHSLEYEFRSSRSDFDLFYFRMYRPLVEQRHRNSAETANYHYFLEKFLGKQADLIFATGEGLPLAAQLIEKRERLYRILAFGIMDGSMEIQKMGVHGALYYFTMVHYGRKGHKYLLCGSSMPVALDGVTQFKIRIGAKPYLKDLPARQRYFLIPTGNDPSAMIALKRNPLFHITGRGLEMAVFIDPDDLSEKEDFLKLYRRIRCENVSQVSVYCFNDPEKIAAWSMEENISNIKCLRYGDPAS